MTAALDYGQGLFFIWLANRKNVRFYLEDE